MPTPTILEASESNLVREFIERSCGIKIGPDKSYFIENRLTTLLNESKCQSFTELIQSAVADKENNIRDKIIDAMTTNETQWFRDTSPYLVMNEVLLKEYAEEFRAGKRKNLRIWCAASSTGQEPYSIAMTIFEFARKGGGIDPEKVEILGTDISPTVLLHARAANYDALSMARGMPEDIKSRYFNRAGKVHELDAKVKKMVTFKSLNLQGSYSIIGKRDIIFCRNVLIYFSSDFKKDVLKRISKVLNPGGCLFTGGSESIINYSADYHMLKHGRALYFKVK